MTGLSLGRAVFLAGYFSGFFVVLKHVVGITMIRAHDHHTARGVNCLFKAGKLEVHTFHRAENRLIDSGVAYHVAVREVEADKVVFSRSDCFNHRIGNFCALHPGSLFEGENVAFDFNVVFEFFIEFAEFVSIEEVGYMAVLLGFADCEGAHTGSHEVFAHGAVDGGRNDEILRRDVEVAVVFHHAGVFNLRYRSAVKPVEFGSGFKGGGELKGTVSAEVEEDNRVTVVNGSYGLAVFRDDEFLQVLVNNAGDVLAPGFDCFMGARELTAFSADMYFPAAFYHGPVGVITIHGDEHASTAGGNTEIDAACVEFGKIVFEGVDILERACFANVAAVEEGVDPGGFNPLVLRFFEHGLEVINMRVNVSVGKETDKVELAAGVFHIGNKFFPGLAFEHGPGFDRGGYEFGSLGKNPAAADGVVAYLAVAHILVGGKTNRGTMRLEAGNRTGLMKFRERFHVRVGDCVAFGVLSVSDAVHYNKHDRAFPALPCIILCKCVNHYSLL